MVAGLVAASIAIQYIVELAKGARGTAAR